MHASPLVRKVTPGSGGDFRDGTGPNLPRRSAHGRRGSMSQVSAYKNRRHLFWLYLVVENLLSTLSGLKQ